MNQPLAAHAEDVNFNEGNEKSGVKKRSHQNWKEGMHYSIRTRGVFNWLFRIADEIF